MLETDIKKLTEAINALNETLSALRPNAFFVAPEPIDDLIIEHANADQLIEEVKFHANQLQMTFDIPPMTHEDLKNSCISAVRRNADNKPVVKTILAQYGAVKVADVANDKIEEIVAKIEAL